MAVGRREVSGPPGTPRERRSPVLKMSARDGTLAAVRLWLTAAAGYVPVGLRGAGPAWDTDQ